MTYKELAESILRFTPEQQNCDVSVFVTDLDEFLPLDCISCASNLQELDDNHPILNV